MDCNVSENKRDYQMRGGCVSGLFSILQNSVELLIQYEYHVFLYVLSAAEMNLDGFAF